MDLPFCGYHLVSHYHDLSCGNDILPCVNDLLTCGIELISCGNNLLTHGNGIKNDNETVLCPFRGSIDIQSQ